MTRNEGDVGPDLPQELQDLGERFDRGEALTPAELVRLEALHAERMESDD